MRAPGERGQADEGEELGDKGGEEEGEAGGEREWRPRRVDVGDGIAEKQLSPPAQLWLEVASQRPCS